MAISPVRRPAVAVLRHHLGYWCNMRAGDNQSNTKQPLLIAAGLIPALLAAYLVVTSGWNVLPMLDPYDGKRVLEIAIISLCLLFGLVYRPLRWRLLALLALIPRPIQLAITLVFVFGLISAMASDHVFYALTEVSLYFSLFALIFFTAASAQLLGDRMATLVAVFVLVLGSLISLTELIGLLVHWQHGQPATSHTLFIRFSHPRFFNQVQSWLIPLMVLPILAFKDRKPLAGLALFNLAFWWALLFYSGGRGSLLGLVCAFGFVFLLVFKNTHFRRARGLHLVAMFAGIGIYLVLVIVPSLLGIDTGDAITASVGRVVANTSGRFHYWQILLQALAEQPLLGSGPGLSTCPGAMTYFAHPHNFYLQLVGEWGVPAGLMAAITIMYVIQATIRYLNAGVNKTQSALCIIVATGALAAGIHAAFSGVMVMPASQVCSVMVLGYLTALLAQPAAGTRPIAVDANPAAHNPLLAAMLALPLVLAVAQLNYFVFTEVPKLESRADTFVENYRAPYSPRLWQHGNICSYVMQEAEKVQNL